MSLLEASLIRVWNHYNNKQFGLLTSQKKEASEKENEANYYKLKDDIKQNDLSYVKLRGFGQEVNKLSGKKEVVEEPSFLVVNDKAPSEEFKNLIISLGQKYKQDYVIVNHPKDAEHAETRTELIKTRPSVKVEQRYKNIHFNKIADFYSQLYGGNRTFTFEKVLANDGIDNHIDGMGRKASGELLELTGSEEDQLLGILEYLQRGT